MRPGLGISLGVRIGPRPRTDGGAIVAPPSGITAPSLTLTTPTGYTPEWDTTLDATVFAGYYYHIEASADGLKNGDGTYTTTIRSIDHQLTDADIAAGSISHAELVSDGWSDLTGTWHLHAWIFREDGTKSPISNELSGTVTSVSAFSFTDVTNASLSTLYTSNTITLGGTGTHTPATVSAGEYSLNGGAWTAAGSFTMQIGDTLAVRQTSSSSYSTDTDIVVTIGGVPDTYSVMTMANPTTGSVTLHQTATASSGTSFTMAAAPFNAGYRVVAVRANANVTGVTIGGAAATKLIQTATGTAFIWALATSGSAASLDVVITCSSAITSAGAFALTAATIGSTTPSDTTLKAIASAGDPKSFDDSLIVPASGIGLVLAAGSASSGITWNNGTLLGGVLTIAGGSYISVASFPPGTTTPSFNTGVSNQGWGCGVAWGP